MQPETCIQCGAVILIMAFRGTGLCSENCRKLYHGESIGEQAIANK